MILSTTVVAARYGDTVLAAHQIVATVWNGLAFALDALAIAAQAITGKALGAAEIGPARSAGATMARWGIGAGAVTRDRYAFAQRSPNAAALPASAKAQTLPPNPAPKLLAANAPHSWANRASSRVSSI